MDQEKLSHVMQSVTAAAEWLQSIGIRNTILGYKNLMAIVDCGVADDLLVSLCSQLEEQLPELDDPGLVLDSLERYIVASLNPLSLVSFFERDPEALRVLTRLFNHSRMLGELLVRDSAAFDLVRLTGGQPVQRDELVRELSVEIEQAPNATAAAQALRLHKGRETLRIAYGDLIEQQTAAVVAEQVTFLADALCESALRFAQRHVSTSRGVPRTGDGEEASFAIVGLGNFGGRELSYLSPLELMFVYHGDGKTDGPVRVPNAEYFERLSDEILNLLTSYTEWGRCYDVEVKQPLGSKRQRVVELNAAQRHYDVDGRTWERQALIKARAVGGDLKLGQTLLDTVQPWIYRRYLSRADFSGVQALKRRLEKQTSQVDDTFEPEREIQHIEVVIAFLQLINGVNHDSVRSSNTLEAIQGLSKSGCVEPQEGSLLNDCYTFLRRIVNLREVMFTDEILLTDEQIESLALKLGYVDDPIRALMDDYRRIVSRGREMVHRLLDAVFKDAPAPEPEVDLVLDPDPDVAFIERTLAPYQFEDISAAYENLTQLATEKISFLSTRRCRHFLAQIAPALLRAIGETPEPDNALHNLCRVSDSLGGKGVLWELFSFSPATLQLYVRLCALSPYLSNILTSNPGMLDELMDSLALDHLPDQKQLTLLLDDWCRGQKSLDLALINFKQAQHLNVGVRDILGKEPIQRTTAFLADVAQACLARVCDMHFAELVQRYGQPWHEEEDRVCQPVMLALGKLGNREPNYHSDMDVLFLYEVDGTTRPLRRNRQARTTSHQHFFSELAQRVTKSVNQHGPNGRLYELDTKLRPTSQGDRISISLPALARYFGEGQGNLAEYQALCTARPIYGSAPAQIDTAAQVSRILSQRQWTPADAETVLSLRSELDAHPRNIKRGPGGLLDIEFLVQMLQLRHVAQHPDVLVQGTFRALKALAEHDCLGQEDADRMGEAYRFLRSVEARLRLMNAPGRHDLPEETRALNTLATLLESDDGPTLARQCQQVMRETRERFDRVTRELASR